MKLSLRPDIRRLIEERVSSGKYASPEDVVHAAILTLDGNERFGDFDPGELDALVAEGERSIREEGTVDARTVFKQLRQRSARRRKKSA